MAKHRLTHEEFTAHVTEQIEFMQMSADAFDRGYTGEAKRLAACARTLLHQTARSTSLLAQLGQRSQPFVDTAYAYDPKLIYSSPGLVGVVGNQQAARYYAPLDSRPRRLTAFRNWWEKDVVVHDGKDTFTRRALVLTLANKDGGSHVDPQLDEAYARLKYKPINAVSHVGADGAVTPVLGLELHSMRQVAHEIIATILPGYGMRLSDDPGL